MAGEDYEVLEERIRALDEELAQVRQDAATLATLLNQHFDESRAIRAWDWGKIPVENRRYGWDALSAWLQAHLGPLSGGATADWAPCWVEHRSVVDHLIAAMVAWDAAYADDAGPTTAALEFFNKSLPDILARVRVNLRDCETNGRHVEPSYKIAGLTEQPPRWLT